MLHFFTLDSSEVYLPPSSIALATVLDNAVRIKLNDGKVIFVSYKAFKEQLQRNGML
jgi:hypothetical protein